MVLDIGVKVQPYGSYSFPFQNLSNPYVFTAFIIYIGYIDLLKPFTTYRKKYPTLYPKEKEKGVFTPYVRYHISMAHLKRLTCTIIK